MNKKKILAMLGIMSILAFTGCGKTKETTADEVVSQTAGELETETESEKSASEETEAALETEEETQTVEADENEYGNTVGNILNGGLFLEDENYFYLYHGYDNCVYRTDKETGASKKVADGYCVHLNMTEQKLYGNRADIGAIVEIDMESGEETTILEKNVEYMTLVDKELYYLSAEDQSLRKFSLDTMEETVLEEQSVSTVSIYKDKVYFSLNSDNGSLYSVSREGGEPVKLNEVCTYMPSMYEDKIYFLGMEEGAYSIRSMALDGSEEQLLANVDAGAMNVHGNKLYYIDNNAKNKMYCLDLSKEKPVPEQIDLTEKIKTAVNKYAVVPVSEYQLDAYMGLNFQSDYMLFMCNETMDGEQYMDEYVYDFTKDEILPVAYFVVEEKEVEKAVANEVKAEEKETAKETSKEAEAPAEAVSEPAAATPARTYPSGNYSPGSVYGPKLSQAELDQVADVVQSYMNSYDFSSMSDYQKVETAHDYLCNVCEYAADWRLNQANTAWGALVYHEAQCSGYARAMKALCDAMGVGCYYVHADENASNPSHQWNVVCIDGSWYIIDVQANDKSGFEMAYLVSDDFYASSTGMSWDRSSVPACPNNYGGKTYYQYGDGWISWD